ncbi:MULTISPECIES: S8 family serine peptidase [unclassified Lysobacter]|uniref:S8 family serine peptidase n=1 Tax=unclassified Lysobacter TaxID=2635362 RepID=UPI001BE80B4B|nr:MULTISPECIES: S8 family serine peptidase [unclassified Lysobacter]MBT2747501.1 S8 family serine peptidase [Lysobacter sp. ISL-42]MBT2752324.1 S8 family serine peptidase [Lysobacter sp. ISL-50]MBT2776257.1 S8 family serine peptidase [Lysobacter sp. ISL-54]MBT2784074.1 S8 family serine peptidase [Lysobacter sp. ISL-52]
MHKVFKKTSIALGVAAVAAMAGASVLSLSGGTAGSAAIGAAPAPTGVSSLENKSQRYIVLYKDAPLSTYKGSVQGLPAPARLEGRGAMTAMSGPSEGRIDVKSANARNYVRHLDQVQSGYEQRIDRALGRQLRIERRMRHALNGIITTLSQSEAAKVASMPEVMLVEEYREYEMATDTGPALIGAPALWNATPTGFRGEGMVIGVLDSGINFGSPSFTAADETGYQHINPLGAGHYLGTCAPGGIDEGRCNDKLIGGYDFVCASRANQCGQPDIREEPGFGDTNGHGSHVASTVAGNVRTATFRGRDVHMSGVAPRANIIAYDVCYTKVSTSQGLCPNVSAADAVDQAIADGVVDAINYSIGGGANPWSEAVSLAFLNATDAGIYVAAAAGNDGPGPATSGHLEPWTATTAAAQHGRGDFVYLLQVTGPGAVPAPLQTVQLSEGTGGVAFAAALPGTTPLRVSAGINGADDGCAAFPAGTFQGAVAVIRRGTCSFAIKAGNAAAAGATALVVVNNAAGGIVPSVPGATIPAFGITQADGNAIRDFSAANTNTSTAGIGYPPTPLPNTPDVLAGFSSRGPAGKFDLVKPDITAPGVAVLAVVAGTSISGSENEIGLKDGTSMASPHHAGAALLVRQAQPTWTVAEVKSALMMTAKQEVFKEDSVTQANAFAMGAGRVQVDQAIKSGLVLNETTANYRAANPATGGDPSSLNVPSMGKAKCPNSCSFTRTFRNTLSTRQTWNVRGEGLSVVVTPLSLVLNPGESKAVKVTVLSGSLPKDGSWNFGKLVLTPQGGNTAQPTLRLPIAVSVPPPAIALAPDQVALSLTAGATGSVNFRIDNAGGSALDYQIDNTGSGTRTFINAPVGAVSSGFRSTQYTDPATAGSPGQYSSDDFTVTEATQITRLYTEGFVSSGQPLATTSTGLTWMIYRDSGGNPEGNPQTSPGTAVWSYSSLPTGNGVAINGAHITLNLAAAGQNVNLAPGRYWLIVYSRSTFANRWVWFASTTGDNLFRAITPGTAGTGAWTASTGFAGQAFNVQGANACGASWIGAPDRAFGRLNPATGINTQVQISAAGLTPGPRVGFVCVSSNDPLRPKVSVRVALTVTPAP